MARYAVSLYGQDFYGAPIVSLYSADPFLAVAPTYGTVHLTWHTPGGTWATLRLVRNYAGYPADEIDGVPIYEATHGDDVADFLDEDLTVDRWVYYSLFAYDDIFGEWVRSGNARCYVPADYHGGERLYNMLPSVYRGVDFNILDADRVNYPLASFMSVLGYTYDLLRNDANSLLDLHSADAVCYDLIPAIMEQFGIPAEYEIGPAQWRRFLRNAIHLYKVKGTMPCVHGVCSAVTGYDSRVRIGSNHLWDADVSDFIGGVGVWETNLYFATVEHIPPVVVDDVVTEVGAMRITAAGGGDAEVSFVSTDEHIELGIPVSPGVEYGARGYLKGFTPTQYTARLVIDWYDVSGALISSDAGTDILSLQMLYTEFNVIAEAPANAVLAGLRIVIVAPAALTEFDVSRMQFGRTESGVLPAHQYGRDIRITLIAERINEVKNPSFEDSANHWVTGVNASIDRDPAVFGEMAGDASARIEYIGGGLLETDPGDRPQVHTAFVTRPGVRYVAQYQISSDAPGLKISVRATDNPVDNNPGLVLDEVEILFDVDDADMHQGESLGFIADSTETSLAFVFIEAATNEGFWVDAVLVEVQAEGTLDQVHANDPSIIKRYFDGSLTSFTGDYFWEDGEHDSRTHFYHRRSIHESRLREILPRYIPFGATFTLLWGQPEEQYYLNDDTILITTEPEPPTAPIGANLALRWDQHFNGASLLALRYNLRANTAAQGLDVRWTDLVPANEDLDARWDVLVPVGKNLGLLYHNYIDGAQELGMLWNVYSVVGKSVALPWHDYAGVGEELELLFNDLATVGDDFGMLWDVLVL